MHREEVTEKKRKLYQELRETRRYLRYGSAGSEYTIPVVFRLMEVLFLKTSTEEGRPGLFKQDSYSVEDGDYYFDPFMDLENHGMFHGFLNARNDRGILFTEQYFCSVEDGLLPEDLFSEEWRAFFSSLEESVSELSIQQDYSVPMILQKSRAMVPFLLRYPEGGAHVPQDALTGEILQVFSLIKQIPYSTCMGHSFQEKILQDTWYQVTLFEPDFFMGYSQGDLLDDLLDWFLYLAGVWLLEDLMELWEKNTEK